MLRCCGKSAAGIYSCNSHSTSPAAVSKTRPQDGLVVLGEASAYAAGGGAHFPHIARKKKPSIHSDRGFRVKPLAMTYSRMA